MSVVKHIPYEAVDPAQLAGRDFLTLADYTTSEIIYLLEDAVTMKQAQKKGVPHAHLPGQVLGMIFEKSSTRTRISFEVGMIQLGGHAFFLSKNDIQLGRGESLPDTANVISRYVDGIMIRTFAHSKIVEMANHSQVPVINGLTDDHHPAQVMADLLTIYEHKGHLDGLKMCFVGDGNNMAHSLIEGGVRVGMDVAIATPSGYEPNGQIVQDAQVVAKTTGSTIQLCTDPQEAAQDADVIITDVWASMGQEEEQAKREQDFAGFQVNEALCAHAKDDYIFMHCLPAHRGEEVTAEIIDGPHSVVFDEAENRLHAQKAILKNAMKKSG